MGEKPLKYVIITPVYNEQDHILQMIWSVRKQTIPPVYHVVVNDASTDGTYTSLKWVKRWIPNLRLIHLAGDKKSVYSHVNAMNIGYDFVKSQQQYPQWDYISILDADVVIPPTYYETLLKLLKPQDVISGQNIGETTRESRGSGRIIHKSLMDKLGPFVLMTGWDTFRNQLIVMYGGKAILHKDPLTDITPLRPTCYSNKHFYKRGISGAILQYSFPFFVGRMIRMGPRGLIGILTYLLMQPISRRFKVSKRFKQHMRQRERDIMTEMTQNNFRVEYK